MAAAAAAIARVLEAGDDYYSVLEVRREASKSDLKRAYRRLALLLHPDKCHEKNAEEAFKKVGEAFSVLDDASRREVYDSLGAAGLRARGGNGCPTAEEVFAAFFGAVSGADNSRLPELQGFAKFLEHIAPLSARLGPLATLLLLIAVPLALQAISQYIFSKFKWAILACAGILVLLGRA
eukprot:TRINITY_DN26617_c0_g3_i1.p1 TRINITY_DN26617_c0_g3~~TRINITY_DN26617_c0_g3_i1.p1  ORF type:complete len:180 (+),score=51.79 TRINITY_DN26617_c0_g3_i1:55-594(+)